MAKIHDELRVLNILERNLQSRNHHEIVSPDLVVSNGQNKFKLNEEATEESVLNKDNYGATEHKCRKCSPIRDDDGFFDRTRHRPECLKDIS